MTPNIVKTFIDNNDFPAPFPFTPTYAVGAASFTVIDAPSWVSINSGTGQITVTPPAPVGVYKFQIKYSITIGEVTTDYYEEFTIVIDEGSKLNATSFQVCQDVDGFSFQLGVEGKTISGCSLSAGPEQITVSDSGLITIIDIADLDMGDNTYTIEYSDGFDTFTQEITITKIACPDATPDTFNDCGPDEIRIVWRNTLGGDEVYYFNQQKSYLVEQDKGSTFVSSDNELKYQSRENIYDGTELIMQLIPKSHANRIRSLRDSIQAWVAPNIDDVDTWIPIIVDSESFTLYDTIEPLINLSFKFRYAKPKLIQNQ